MALKVFVLSFFPRIKFTDNLFKPNPGISLFFLIY